MSDLQNALGQIKARAENVPLTCLACERTPEKRWRPTTLQDGKRAC